MRVLFVINTMGRGGAEVQVVDLATELVTRGHDVAVAVLLPFEDFEDALRAAGVVTFSLGLAKGAKSPRALLRLIRFARSFGPDVIHGHMFAGNMAARATAALMSPFKRPKVVCTSHIPTEAPRRHIAYRGTDFLCDAFTFVSLEGLKTHERANALPRGRGMVLPNGIHLERFEPATEPVRAEARAELGLHDEFVWLAIGSFRDEQKDYSNLLRALASNRGWVHQRLLIAGEGKLLDEKRAEASALGLADEVTFLGLRSDVPRLMRCADAYVMSSAWEGLPIVLLEAAASALPMVVTDVGGNRDIVTDDCGFVVPPKDPQHLAVAMQKLMTLPIEERRALGMRARERAENQFSIKQVVTKWEALYRKVLGA